MHRHALRTCRFGECFIERDEIEPHSGSELQVRRIVSCQGAPIGKGTQRDVQVSGKDLSTDAVLSTLEKAGFSGTVEAKKK